AALHRGGRVERPGAYTGGQGAACPGTASIAMTRRLALALRHVGFEDLGSFEIPLKEAGYAIEYIDIAERDPATLDPLDADLFFILGGPISVYDHADYPFIAAEIELLRVRLGADLPTL